jgi:hypothetical protein
VGAQNADIIKLLFLYFLFIFIYFLYFLINLFRILFFFRQPLTEMGYSIIKFFGLNKKKELKEIGSKLRKKFPNSKDFFE